MKPCLAVIGANGFIGARTVELFHLSGWAKVRPVVRRAPALANSSRFSLDGRVADGRDFTALKAAFEGCDYVVHVVAGDPQTIAAVVEPVYRAAEVARVKRIVYLSSASVHGQSPLPGTNEESPLDDRQPIPYNNAKVRAERHLMEIRRAGNVEVVILRPGIVFGPRSMWIGGFADELLAGTAYLVDGGHGICNAAYIDNVVHGIRLAIQTPAADGQVYIIGDSENVSWRQLCLPIAETLGFDIEKLSVKAPSSFKPSLGNRARDLELVRAVARHLPMAVRHGLKAGYAEWSKRSETGQFKKITVTEERALLHRCKVKLSSAKAERQLGYRPIVSFSEACRRSVGWLRFAGYPTISIPKL